jgi:hypothetical protein
MKLFTKVKTITSKSGEVHFERWAIIETSRFAWYLHRIHKEDQDHMHSHPWNFVSLILKGSYLEDMTKNPRAVDSILNVKKPFKIAFFDRSWFHSIRRIIDGPIWTMVWVWGGSFAGDKWHYLVDDGAYYYKIPFDMYRIYKTRAKDNNLTLKQYFEEYPRIAEAYHYSKDWD